MFCSNCGHKINSESIFCAICGTKVIQKTTTSKLNNAARGIILICKKMNWGQICRNSGTWLSTKWTVYADRTIVREMKYDSCFFNNSEGKTYIKDTALSDENFNKLKLWLKDVFPFTSVSDGCDGTGWKITSFDENADILHTVVGYIYNDTAFETMLEFLDERT